MRSNYALLLVALLGLTIFSGIAFWRAQHPLSFAQPPMRDRIVIGAPTLLALYGGDRFFAANLEAIRLAATGMQGAQSDTEYLIRAQHVVAQLNACHEDNYYLANGLLTWGGAVSEGNHVLREAVRCRTWDFIPAFFYGINLAFFQRDTTEAQRILELAAQRSPENAPSLRRLAIMLRVESFADEKLALEYLAQQRDAASDPRLHDLLDKRVVRLQGLVVLREAQRNFEEKSGVLARLEQLVESGLLPALPDDPLRLGYELHDGKIILKKITFGGIANQP